MEVLREDRMVDLGPPRQRAVLAALLLHANEVVSRERLIEDVWGETPPASAPNMIQVYVSGLRKALGGELLVTRAPGYLLRVDEALVDAERFAELIQRARDAMGDRRADEARSMINDAIELWRGPPLADFTYESFAQGDVARLEELRLEGIELRVEAELALGQHVRLVGELEQLVLRYPFRERLRGQLMLALYRAGRQAEALDAYRAARRTLVDQLGIEPGPELQALERAILTQDEELEPTGRATRSTVPVTVRSRATNVPAELTSLIGREADTERVRALIDRHRLVTLVGSGGVGKTRVAQRVARSSVADFDHGAWFVDLLAVERRSDVAGMVLTAVGISDRPGSAALDTVVDGLRARSLLLVLDNCEHVLAATAALGTRIVVECPGVRLLATSRAPLAVPGERVARLEPLATEEEGSGLPAAAALFVERAESYGASSHRPEEVATIRELCKRLDGIPLAIELAAARTRAMGPAELLGRLDDRLRLLVRPGHSATRAHQQTLEATIAWSYDLLSSGEQATLRRLGVFHGGFSLTAAEAVCDDIGSELDTVDRMTTLVDSSVVSIERRAASDRYHLLESIALFALRQLIEQREEGLARDRHARFFLGLVQASCHPVEGDQAASVQTLDLEQENLIASLRWCLRGGGDPTAGAELAAEVGWHWILRGRSNLAQRWLARALEHGERLDARAAAAVYIAYALLAYSTSALDTSLAYARKAVATARSLGNDELLAEALAQVALASQGLGKHDEAVAAAAELRSLQPRLCNPRARAMALLGTAQVALANGDPERAVADAATARDIAWDAGDHLRAANSGFWLSHALALGSGLAAARAAIAEAGRDAMRSGYQMVAVDILSATAALALADEDADGALRVVARAVEMLREQQRWEDLGACLRLAAGIELKRASPAAAAVLLGASLRWTDRLDFQDELLLPELAGLEDQLEAALGRSAFADARGRGAAMDLDAIASFVEQAAASAPGVD
jgi:predicted ATPase/DNA-binding SARP family transcriptional activator